MKPLNLNIVFGSGALEYIYTYAPFFFSMEKKTRNSMYERKPFSRKLYCFSCKAIVLGDVLHVNRKSGS